MVTKPQINFVFADELYKLGFKGTMLLYATVQIMTLECELA